LGTESKHIATIMPVADKLTEKQKVIREAIYRHQHQLCNLLSEITDNMQAARLASKSTRFEAAQLTAHRDILESIARAMEDIVTEIEELADTSEELLITGFERYKRKMEHHER
jgi:vacuolar-type H+-ATPase subunit E/Vma4